MLWNTTYQRICCFCFLWKHSGICLPSFFSMLIYKQIYVWHPCLFVFSTRVYSDIALLNNCPMHGEFPSDAWLKMNAREKTIFKGEINVFSTKSSNIMIRIFSKYIVTEIKWFFECLVLKGMSFIMYKLINFGRYFSEWCQILSHFKVIPAKVLSPRGYKIRYYYKV